MGHNVFEQMAKKYDTEERIKLAEIITREVKLELENSQGKSLLDYGCGTGLVSLELSHYVDSILLVDSTKEMLDIVEGKINQRGITNAKVLHSDFTQVHANLNVDIIFMSLVLLHIPNTKKILQHLFEVLHHNGKLIIVDFNKNHKINHPKVHNGFSHDELKEILHDIGFQSVNIRTFYEGKQIFMNQDASMFIASSIK